MQKKGPFYRSHALFLIGRILGLIMVSYTLRVTLVNQKQVGGVVRGGIWQPYIVCEVVEKTG